MPRPGRPRPRRSSAASADRPRSTSRGGTAFRRRCRARRPRRTARRTRPRRSARPARGARRRSGRSRTARPRRSRSISGEGASSVEGRPADVRQLQAGRANRLDRALEQAEAARAAVLGGGLEEELHPEADSEQRHAGGDALGDRRRPGRDVRSRASPRGRRRRPAGRAPAPTRCSPGSELTTADAPTCSNAFATERRLPMP